MLHLDQFFTDPDLAIRVAKWAVEPMGFLAGKRFLEPSCGDGALVRGLIHCGVRHDQITALEIYASLRDVYAQNVGNGFDPQPEFTCVNFLKFASPKVPFDLCLMNSPYRDRQDETHLVHALSMSRRVVTLCLASLDYSQRRYDAIWRNARITRRVKLKNRPVFHGPDCKGNSAQYNYQVLDIENRMLPHKFSAGPETVLEEIW